jgi:type VI protein secretion system component Hcp
MRTLPLALGLIALALGPPAARGTTFAVLLAPGLSGESQVPGFAGGIDIGAFTLDGPLASGTAGTCWLHKRPDKASLRLFGHCARGRHIPKAELFLLDPPPPGTTTQAAFCKITLTEVLVLSFQCSTEGPDSPPWEGFQLRFGRVFFEYQARDGALALAYLALAQTGPDSDGDGMSDPFESYFGFDPQTGNGDSDSDEDGLSDKDEARLGFNPVAADSFFRCEVAAVPGNEEMIEIGWDCVPGTDYVIEWTPDASQPFQPILAVRPDTLRFAQARVRQGLSGFFRVRLAGR